MFKAGPNKNGVLQAHLETSSGRVQMTVKVDSMTHFCRVLSYFKIQMLDGQHKLRRQPYLKKIAVFIGWGELDPPTSTPSMRR